MCLFDHILIRWICVLAISFTGLLSGKAVVICVDSHGHTTVEWTHKDSDCDHGRLSEIETGYPVIIGHCHNMCDDIAVPALMTSGLSNENKPLGVVFSNAPILFEVSWKQRRASALPGLILEIPPDQQIAPSLRGIILLI